jgi:hypothetical protein
MSTIMKKSLIFGFSALVASTLLMAAPAQARGSWSVNVGIGGFGYYPPPVVYAAPRAYYPPPVVYSPAPVYPVVQQPVVEYSAPVVVYGYPDRHWQDPRYDRYPHYHGGYRRGYREYRDYSR